MIFTPIPLRNPHAALVFGPRGAGRRCRPRALFPVGTGQPGPVGADVLAGERDHVHRVEAFTADERITRPFVEANQALAGSGGSFLLPGGTPRNSMLSTRRSLPRKRVGMPSRVHQLGHSSLCLPDYGHAVRG